MIRAGQSTQQILNEGGKEKQVEKPGERKCQGSKVSITILEGEKELLVSKAAEEPENVRTGKCSSNLANVRILLSVRKTEWISRGRKS